MIRAGDVSPVDVVEAFARRIDEVNPRINAFVTLRVEEALAEARAAERAVLRGDEVGLLHGLPVGIKDLTETAGIRTTFGSALHEDYVPAEDAAVVSRLKAAGAIVLGKTTTPEHGSHVVTHSPVFGVTRNPWRLDLTPGGSSGGSAAAVAAEMLPLAHGTDGGGSIRVPAAQSGVVGFKPSYGRISNAPSVEAYLTLSHHGPLARSVDDAWLMFRAMVGYDPRDPYSLPDADVNGALRAPDSLRGLRVAWSPDLGYATVDARIVDVTRSAATAFEALGAVVEEAHPGFDDPRPYFNVLLAAHMASVVLPDAYPTRAGFDAMMDAVLDMHDVMTPTSLADALRRRSELYLRCVAFFERFDLLLTPTMGAMPLPADAALGPNMRVEGLYFTHPFNLTHLPAVSVPAGWTDDGLPVGLQMIAGPRRDRELMQAAALFERERPWRHMRPSCGR